MYLITVCDITVQFQCALPIPIPSIIYVVRIGRLDLVEWNSGMEWISVILE